MVIIKRLVPMLVFTGLVFTGLVFTGLVFTGLVFTGLCNSRVRFHVLVHVLFSWKIKENFTLWSLHTINLLKFEQNESNRRQRTN